MKLPRRDYFLLPLLSLATMIAMFGSAEVAARIRYPEKDYDEPDRMIPGARSQTAR